MKNEFYTVFIKPFGGSAVDEFVLIETKDKGRCEDAKRQAKEKGFVITREYFPDTELTAPNFGVTI